MKPVRTHTFKNGKYKIIRGKPLKELKLLISENDVDETNFVDIKKAPQLGAFDFRTFLNIGMLMTESPRAVILRQAILDIVIDTINARTGGGTKYINQRDEDFIIAYFQEENYRQTFTDALRDCVDMGTLKYPIYTDKVYVSIFREDAREYRKILVSETVPSWIVGDMCPECGRNARPKNHSRCSKCAERTRKQKASERARKHRGQKQVAA